MVWIARLAACCDTLVYVDDLAGLTFGPGPTLLLHLALIASTHLAGLVVEDHHCLQLVGPRGAAAAQLLDPFPSRLQLLSGDRFCLPYGPVEVYGRLLVATDRLRWTEFQVTRHACSCKTKHGLVPRGHHGLWANALACTPLAAALTERVRFLGTKLASCWAGAAAPALLVPGFTFTQLRLAAHGTYERCLRTVGARTTAATAAQLAFSNRAFS